MTIPTFLSAQKGGDKSQEWIVMEDFYNRKLWHQLTLELVNYVKIKPQAPGHLSELYNTFLSDFDHRVSTGSSDLQLSCFNILK